MFANNAGGITVLKINKIAYFSFKQDVAAK